MSIIKKARIGLIMALLFAVMFVSNVAFAQNNMKLSLSNAEGNIGEPVEVLVTLENIPDNLSSISLKIHFDPTQLKVVSVEDTKILAEFSNPAQIKESYIEVLWGEGLNTIASEKSGAILKLCFEVLEDAKGGQTELRTEVTGAYDFDLNEVGIENATGTVTITLPVHDHTWSDWTETKPATCTEDGTKERECTFNGCEETEEETLPKTGHSFDGKQEEIKKADCTNEGSLRTYCSNDNCTAYTDSVIPKLNHTEGEWKEVKAATCTEEGVKEQRCAICNEKLKEEVIPVKGHSYGEWITEKEAGVNTEGLKSRKCGVCGNREEEIIPAIVHEEKDHVFDGKEEIIEEANCTEEGIVRNYCSFDGCTAYKDTVIPAKGHTEGEWTEVKAAGCTEEGLKEQRCAVCNEKLKEEVIPVKGHSYGEWTIEKEAGLNTEGLKSRKCGVCGNREEEIIPAIVHEEKDHVFDGKEEIIEEANCTEEGIVRNYCSFDGCTAYKDTVILAKGHAEGEWTEVKAAGCVEEGLKEQRCTVCDEKLKEEVIPVKGHAYGEWTIEKEAGLNTEGLKSRKCGVCGNREEEIIPAIVHEEKDHVFDGKEEIIKEATCTEEGKIKIYCSYEGCEAFVEKNVPANGHAFDEWKVVKEPQVGVEGAKERTCTACGHTETEILPALEESPEKPEEHKCWWKILFDKWLPTKPEKPEVPEQPVKPEKPDWSGMNFWKWIFGWMK